MSGQTRAGQVSPVRPGRPGRSRSVGGLLVALVAALLALLAFGAAPASASGEVIQGTLTAGAQPVVGATVTATLAGGSPESVQTDATGHFLFALTGGPGSYAVMLDPSTLPSGVTIAAGAPNPLTIMITAGGTRAALFRLDKAGFTAARSQTIQSLQLLVDGIKLGLIIAMAAVGLSLVYGTTGLTNFAHGELVTLGALVAYFFNVKAGMPFLLAALLSVLVCALANGLLDIGLWRPLKRRGTGLIAALVVSIGLSLFLRYLYLFFFGGEAKAFTSYTVQKPYDLTYITITPKDIVVDVVSLVVLISVGLALQKTKLGTAIRAVADNKDLAAASGIAVDRVITIVWIVGGGLAALGGIFLGLLQQNRFDMGFTLLLLIFAGVTLGGLGTAYGALLGGVLIGVLTNMSTLVIPSELKNVGALVVLVLVLLVRPTGLLGRRERIG